MATEGLRRSTRVRKAVKSYATEQAEASEPAITEQPQKRKRKPNDDVPTEAAKPYKKAANKTKATSKDDNETATEEPTTKKAAKASSSKPKRTATNSSWHADAAERRIAVSKRNVRSLAPGQAETRLKDYVDEPPKAYHEAVKRANTQRMFVLERERGVEDDCHALNHDCPVETVQIAGSTGNVYTVTISHVPTCTCPAGIFTRKGQEKACKHILYVLHNVLKAPDHLKQQNAFLTSELKQIFSNAPALPSQIAEDEPQDGNRKAVEDDCPICCMEFEDGEEIVWCRAACGNNVHKTCFDQWAKTKAHGHVTCPFCRTVWEYGNAPKLGVKVANVEIPESIFGRGYRNVRDQLEYD